MTATPGAEPPRPKPERLPPSTPGYQAIVEAHVEAVAAGQPGYLDPTSGLFVLTAATLAERGSCCGQGCRHCPYPLDPDPPPPAREGAGGGR